MDDQNIKVYSWNTRADKVDQYSWIPKGIQFIEDHDRYIQELTIVCRSVKLFNDQNGYMIIDQLWESNKTIFS